MSHLRRRRGQEKGVYESINGAVCFAARYGWVSHLLSIQDRSSSYKHRDPVKWDRVLGLVQYAWYFGDFVRRSTMELDEGPGYRHVDFD